MDAVVGACPRCGSPIYGPAVWNSVAPAPVSRSCACFAEPASRSFTTTSSDASPPRFVVLDLMAK